jgi:hypothetical protein
MVLVFIVAIAFVNTIIDGATGLRQSQNIGFFEKKMKSKKLKVIKLQFLLEKGYAIE